MKVDPALIKELPEPFDFYCTIVSSGHLHFGLWPDGASDWPLERAQEHMFETLRKYMPDPPAAVLDVGCGLGESAHRLAREGFRVFAIAPSEPLIELAARRRDGGDGNTHPPGFEAAGFLDDGDARFRAGQYDVILFQESLQYLSPLDDVMARTRSLLKPGGVVILGDEIRLDRSLGDQTAVHHHSDVMTALLEHGFRVTRHRRIGPHVKETCTRVIRKFTENFEAIVRAVDRPGAEERLRFFLDGWRSQQEWYESGRLGYELFAARWDGVSIRPYREGDEEAILPMFERIFFTKRTPAHWRWKYRDNPFGSTRIVQAFADDGEMAAHFAAYPVPFYSSVGAPGSHVVFQGGDTMTNPKHRKIGRGATSVLARTVTYFNEKYCVGRVPFNYGYNTAIIRKFGERFLNYRYTPFIPYHTLDLTGRRLSASDRLRRWMSGVSIDRVARVDEEYDLFFERVRDDYGALVERTSRYLQWRYLDCPDNAHHLFSVRRFGTLIGWSVFSERGEALIWGDALFDNRYGRAAAWMIDRVARRFFTGATRVEGWFSPVPAWWTRILAGMGFTGETEPNRLAPAFRIFDPAFSVELFERHNYYTMGDSDLF